MAMTGDQTRTGKMAVSMSRSARPATGGNKNVQSSARRKSSGSQVPAGRIGRTHKGPDQGNG